MRMKGDLHGHIIATGRNDPPRPHRIPGDSIDTTAVTHQDISRVTSSSLPSVYVSV